MSANADTHAPDVLSTPAAGGLVIRGSALRVGGYGVGIALLAAASVILLRHLGVVRFGQYVTVTSIVAVASTIADAGLTVVGSRELALLKPGEPRRRLLGNMLSLRLVIAPIGVIGGAIFALVAGYPREMLIGTLLAGGGLMLSTIQGTLLLGPVVELRNGRVAAVEVTKQAVTVLGIALLAAAGASLTPFFAVPILVGVVAIALSRPLLGRAAIVGPRVDREVWRPLIREALPIAAAFVLATLYLRIVVVLMSLVSTPVETGLFGTSYRILDTLTQVPTLLAGIALPLLTAAVRDGDFERLRYALQRVTEVGTTCAALIVVVTVLAADSIVVVLGGSQYAHAASVLRIQSCALLGIFLSQFWSAAVISLHRQRELIVVNGVALAGLGVFAALLIPRWGANGGALAGVLGDLLLASLLLWRLRRAGPGGDVRFRFLWRVLVTGGVALAPGLIPGLPEPVVAVLGVLIFGAAAWLLGLVPRELLDALRARRAA